MDSHRTWHYKSAAFDGGKSAGGIPTYALPSLTIPSGQYPYSARQFDGHVRASRMDGITFYDIVQLMDPLCLQLALYDSIIVSLLYWHKVHVLNRDWSVPPTVLFCGSCGTSCNASLQSA